MSPPRLFYWAELFAPSIGGIETFSASLLPLLVRRGYEVHVLTSGDGTLPSREDMDGYAVHRLPLRAAIGSGDPGLLLEAIGRVRRLKQAIGPAVVHLNFSGPMALFHIRTAGVHPGPFVTTFHNTFDNLRIGGTLLSDIFARSDWLVANSNSVLAEINEAAPDAADRTSLIYCGVEPGDEATPLDMTSPPHLLFVGRLIGHKGADLALESLAGVRERFPGARLTVVGDGPERGALEHRAAALGIADSVRFEGWARPASVPALMREATLVVMPSRWREPFGLVAVEAALRGRPVLGTAGGGLTEAIEDGVSGRLVARNDGAALTETAIAMLSDRAALAAMGARARERAIRLFGIEASASALDTLYRRLASLA